MSNDQLDSNQPDQVPSVSQARAFRPEISGSTEFASVHSYRHFARSVSKNWRFTRDEVQEAFLAAVLATSGSRQETIAAGTLLWRAQEGCRWPANEEEEQHDPGPNPFSRKRMKPLGDRATEGRVNPRGIPCLYAATHRDTAVAEVRPWVGAYVSVAALQLARPLTVVNCTSDDRRSFLYFGDQADASPQEREKSCWIDIDRAFARPVDRDDQLPDYVPTQVIAEIFRHAGFDGIAYRSSLGEGHNVALFDLDAAHVIRCHLFEIRGVRFDIDEAANPYYCMEPDPTVEVRNYIASIMPAHNPSNGHDPEDPHPPTAT